VIVYPETSMSEEYQIDLENRVIMTRCWGVLCDQDIIQHRARLAADPAFNPMLSQLVDTSEVTEITLTPSTMVLLGQSTLFNPAAKRAYVVTKDVMFGLVRMYELYQSIRGTQTVRVFRIREEALQWLGKKEASAA
jgi:hypothetical protein